MDRYRVLHARTGTEVEREMNELARQGYRFVAISLGSGDSPGIVAVMEYESGGLAGTVEAEALQSGTPSQGPTAERQWSEDELGTGRI